MAVQANSTLDFFLISCLYSMRATKYGVMTRPVKYVETQKLRQIGDV